MRLPSPRDDARDVERPQALPALSLTRLASGPTPEDAVALIDHLEHFLAQLKPTDREILELRMQGFNNLEIADKLAISDRKIRRLMERIRGVAEQMGMTP